MQTIHLDDLARADALPSICRAALATARGGITAAEAQGPVVGLEGKWYIRDPKYGFVPLK